MTTAKKIKYYREARGMTQAQFARALNVSRQMAQQIECNDRRKFRRETLEKVAAVLEVEINDLMPSNDQEYYGIGGGTIADKISFYRWRRGLTQQQLAEMTGMSASNFSIWERGERIPQYRTLVKIAYALDINVEDLLEDHENTTWISSNEQRPQIGSVGIVGHEARPEILTSIIAVNGKSGETLYFTGEYRDKVQQSKGSEHEYTFCKEASIKWWMPLPPLPIESYKESVSIQERG